MGKPSASPLINVLWLVGSPGSRSALFWSGGSADDLGSFKSHHRDWVLEVMSYAQLLLDLVFWFFSVLIPSCCRRVCVDVGRYVSVRSVHVSVRFWLFLKRVFCAYVVLLWDFVSFTFDVSFRRKQQCRSVCGETSNDDTDKVRASA